MSKEALIEKLRGYKSTPRHCEELCYEAANEIESLRQQLVTLKTELKIIGEAIDDPRTDLTMTMSELILEYKQQLADINAAVMHESDVAESYREEADNLRQQLADMTKERDKAKAMPMKYRRMEFNAQLQNENESLHQQLADSQKQVVMLREALEYHQAQTRPIQRTEEALAATDDLDGLILCDAVEVGWIGTGPRDRRCEFSESKPANSVMRDFNMKPLYRAWEPK